LPEPKKNQYWFEIDQPYMVLTSRLPFVEDVNYDRRVGVPRQGLTFAIDEPDLEGVIFQLTRRGKLGVSAPRGMDIEVVLEGVKPYLDKAAETPVKLTPGMREEGRRFPPSVSATAKGDDREIIADTRLAIVLGRCYDLLFDVHNIVSMTFKKPAREDERKVGEKLVVVRNLLMKYNPSLKKEELEREEKKAVAISLTDLLSGGFWWGKTFVKWGLRERYLHLLGLAKELPNGPAKDEVLASLSLFRDVTPKLDEKLRGLTPVDAT
jgi:hypothetical protein